MAEETEQSTDVVGYIQDHSEQIVGQLSEYSYLISDAMVSIFLGILFVFVLHMLASRFIYPLFTNQRPLRVMFGALYVLVFVLAAIGVLKKAGVDVGAGGSIAVLLVLALAVTMYFIIPFLPRLPFVPGHTVETHGILGTVETVTSFHTTIRKFDGTMVFIPNAMVVASKILNFSYTPHRRIEITLRVKVDSDLDAAKEELLAVANSDPRVQADPAPAVFATHADAAGIELVMYCWVENAAFLGARSDLWQEILKVAGRDSGLALSLPRQEVHVSGPQQLAVTESPPAS